MKKEKGQSKSNCLSPVSWPERLSRPWDGIYPLRCRGLSPRSFQESLKLQSFCLRVSSRLQRNLPLRRPHPERKSKGEDLSCNLYKYCSNYGTMSRRIYESPEKLLFALWLHRFKKRLHRFFFIYQCISNLCNRSLIDIIRDFWTYSEISLHLSQDQIDHQLIGEAVEVIPQGLLGGGPRRCNVNVHFKERRPALCR